MPILQPIETITDIPEQYRNTPIELLIRYHNLGEPFDTYTNAALLVGMCMDNRKSLTIPDNFAFIIRAGGANLRYSEFKVSFAIAVGGVKAIALIGHNNCGMVNILGRKDQFIKGLVENGGWLEEDAEEAFEKSAPIYEIGSETDFILTEVKRLRLRYPKIIVAPFIYKVEENKLYSIKEE